MRSESSSPLHSNFLDAATARFRAANALNIVGFCPKRSLRARLNTWCGALPSPSPSGNNRGGGGRTLAAVRSVRLIPVATNSYIYLERHR